MTREIIESVKISLLIADDSPVFRHFLKQCVAGMGDVEVVGEARDGVDAMEKMQVLCPDVVTLDMTMPRLDGIQILRAMRRRKMKTKAIVLTSRDQPEARLVQALSEGASECVLKPDDFSGSSEKELSDSLYLLLRSVVRKTKHVARRGAFRIAEEPQRRALYCPDVLAIGASTGGPAALQELFTRLPRSFPLPIIVTQHMPTQFLSCFVDRLDRELPQNVCLAEEGMRLDSGTVYFAPGNKHLEIVRHAPVLLCHLSDAPPEHHCRPAVDPMFLSLAALAPLVRTLAVVLTGMGEDGAAGCVALCRANGYVIAQDEASSVVWGMPGAVVNRGGAHEVVPMQHIAEHILKLCMKSL